jgi:TusA-related sulfurtransferase
MVYMSLYHLDARRLLCPLPVIRTQNKIKQMQSGDELEVTATDPGVMQDIPTWCRINGHQVLKTKQQDNDYIIRLQVGE